MLEDIITLCYYCRYFRTALVLYAHSFWYYEPRERSFHLHLQIHSDCSRDLESEALKVLMELYWTVVVVADHLESVERIDFHCLSHLCYHAAKMSFEPTNHLIISCD